MAGVKVDAEIGRRKNLKKLPEDDGRAHKILPSRPLVFAEEHRAVFNGDSDIVIFREFDNRRPDLFYKLEVFLNAPVLIAADKSRDHVDFQFRRCSDQSLQMGNSRFPFGFIRIQSVRIKSAKVLYAVGLNGDIPFTKSDTSLLSDGDLNELDGFDIKVEPKFLS